MSYADQFCGELPYVADEFIHIHSCSFPIRAKSNPAFVWHLNNEKNPGWLGYIEDYTTQVYRDYNKPLQGSLLTNQYNGK